MTSRLVLFGVGVVAVLLTTACGDPLATTATLDTVEDTLAVYALSYAPSSGPSALNTFVPRVVRTDPSQNYDVVFDLRVDPETHDTVAYLLPPKTVGIFTRTTGLLKATEPYDAILQAPTTGYDDSTAVAVHPGDVYLVQAQSFACAAQLVTGREFIYSKIVIDSVQTAPYDPFTRPDGGTIYFRIRVDPNCGFISFADGLPKS